MRTLNTDAKGMRFFGFEHLTGESCAYSMRILYDLSERGKKHIENFLGGTVEVKKGTNWNGHMIDERDYPESRESKVEPTIASVLLPCSNEFKFSLLLFCALQEGYYTLCFPKDKMLIISRDEAQIKETKEYYDEHQIVFGECELKEPSSKNRNVHQMTGRTI
jgi:hypothetical protein